MTSMQTLQQSMVTAPPPEGEAGEGNIINPKLESVSSVYNLVLYNPIPSPRRAALCRQLRISSSRIPRQHRQKL